MRINFHDDIISKPYCSVMVRVNGDPGVFHELINNLTYARLTKSKGENKEELGLQVAKTLVDYLRDRIDDPDLIGDIECAPYQPEDLNDPQVRCNILSMCAHAKFIPFVVELTKNDIETMDSHVHIMVAGIGEHPEYNILVTVFNIPGIVKTFDLKFEEGEEDMHHLVYPVVFDALKGSFGSVATQDVISIQYCTAQDPQGESEDIEHDRSDKR